MNGQMTFCDVRVFNPLARCHLHHSLPAVHKKNESEKKREYNQLRLHVLKERAGNAAVSFPHTAERLANRRKEPKSKSSACIKARLNFALIRSHAAVFVWNKNTLNR